MKGPKDTAILPDRLMTDNNSSAPKPPPTAFHIFMKQYTHENKENFPDIISATEGCTAKWSSMSESEKAPYVAKAAKKKAEYEFAMKQHNNDIIVMIRNDVTLETAKEMSASTLISLGDTKQEASSP